MSAELLKHKLLEFLAPPPGLLSHSLQILPPLQPSPARAPHLLWWAEVPDCSGSWVLEVDRSQEGWLDTAGERFKPPEVKGKHTRVGGASRARPGQGFSGAPGGGAGFEHPRASRRLWAELSRPPRTSPPLPLASPEAELRGSARRHAQCPRVWLPLLTAAGEEFGELVAWDATHRPGRKEHPGEFGEMQVPGFLQFRGRWGL